MNDLLIHPYTSDTQFKKFPNLDADLALHYDRVYDTVVEYEITPRYFYETGLKLGFRDIFYYIDTLYANDPQSVIDVGCGECIWKKWFPNIIGFDPNTNEFSAQDFQDYFDEYFSRGHVDHWDNGMALNSIHFISWNNINHQIDLAMNIVKKRFLFTFNFSVMHDVPQLTMEQQVTEFYQKLVNSKYKLILFDAPVLRGISQHKIKSFGYLNGTVRFILSKE
jgi:hypothetical protein